MVMRGNLEKLLTVPFDAHPDLIAWSSMVGGSGLVRENDGCRDTRARAKVCKEGAGELLGET